MSSAAAPTGSPSPRPRGSSSSAADIGGADLTLAPDPSGWVRTLTHAAISDEQKAVRAELGLPTDRPVVMSGHQAGFWHAGILAKHLAIDAAARAGSAHAAWLVVDQNTEPPLRLAWPEREGERLVRIERDLERGVHPDVPTGVRSPVDVAAVPEPFAEIVEPLGFEGRSIGEQAARANAAVIRARLGIAEPTFVLATCLARLGAFAQIVERMAGDAEACVSAYNDAARAHPDAGVRALVCRPEVDRIELPLWHVRQGEPRRGVTASEVRTIPIDELAPKALLMTTLVRAFACDLFVHGTGGAAYDRVTEAWIDSWLGWRLAPTAVATATLRLDPARFGGVTPAAERDLADARWRAHAARHRPGIVGDEEAEAERMRLVGAIEAAPRKSAERADLYSKMHALIETHREERRGAIESLDAEAERLAASRADAAIALDRTWAWVLHSHDDLAALRGRIDATFGVTR